MASKVLSPRESAKFISSVSKDVRVVEEKVVELSETLFQIFQTKTYSLKSWKGHQLHPQECNDSSANWIFLADTLNFSFWSAGENDNKFGVSYNGKIHTGYWSLHAAINRAVKEGTLITSPHYFANMSKQEFCHFLRSDTDHDMPLLDERYEIMKETGRILIKKFNGSFATCIQQCNQSAQKLVDLVVDNFESYKDEAEYNGCRVSFYKRAQILVADIWACFEGEGLGCFHDINSITMFADYRVPQVLVYFGVMEYSDSLKEKLRKGEMFKTGDPEEVEIRGCSIWAVELLKETLTPLIGEGNSAANSIMIDYYLWDYRRLHVEEVDKAIPFHKIRCIYY